MASWAVLASAIFDFFDGMLARILNAYSDIGKDLDSLADVVSFGVLPSVIVFQLFLQAPQISNWLPYSAFLIAIFSALRLAGFNNDSRQTENFIGLPTPANALLIASFPFIINEESAFITVFILNPYFLFIFSVGIGILLIAEIPLLSLKFQSAALKDNLLRYILVFSSLILLIIFKFAAVPLIVIIYFIISFIYFKPRHINS